MAKVKVKFTQFGYQLQNYNPISDTRLKTTVLSVLPKGTGNLSLHQEAP